MLRLLMLIFMFGVIGVKAQANTGDSSFSKTSTTLIDSLNNDTVNNNVVYGNFNYNSTLLKSLRFFINYNMPYSWTDTIYETLYLSMRKDNVVKFYKISEDGIHDTIIMAKLDAYSWNPSNQTFMFETLKPWLIEEDSAIYKVIPYTIQISFDSRYQDYRDMVNGISLRVKIEKNMNGEFISEKYYTILFHNGSVDSFWMQQPEKDEE